MSFYGNEETGMASLFLYTEEDAREMLNAARFVLEMAKTVIRGAV